jgi:hypothetical protein
MAYGRGFRGGFGPGRGYGRGYGSRWPYLAAEYTTPDDSELTMLKREAQSTKTKLDAINQRIADLEK